MSALPNEPFALDTGSLLPRPDDILHEISVENGSGAIFGFSSRDMRSRGFNLLRGQIAKIIASSQVKLIGVTSATPKVGKSFVASNLAAALSRSPENQVVLVDLDLRRASVAQNFGLAGTYGVSDFLMGEIDSLVPTAVRVIDHGLTILPSYTSPESSADLLSGPRMTALIAALRALPPGVIVVCDMPPAFANDDAVIIARQLDGYLFVIEEGVTTRRQIRDSVELLNPSPMLGSVLNRHISSLIGDDYGYGYSSGAYSKYYG